MTENLLEIDDKSRKKALNPLESFIVQAPAGSGKTELLIQRYLTLLSHVSAPEEILAVTFTKKAANEMRMRICKALQESALNTPIISAHQETTRKIANAALAKDNQLHWSLLENPTRLRILTIDALCQTLTRQLPLLSQLGASAAISETPDLIYQEAIEEVLLHLEANDAWSDAITILLIHLDNNVKRLHDLLIMLLKKRDQWLNYIHLDFKSENIRSFLEAELTKVVYEYIDEVEALFPINLFNETKTIATGAAQYLLDTDSDSPILACLNPPKNKTEKTLYWRGLAELLLTKEGKWRKQFNKNNGFPAASEFKNKEEKQLADQNKKRASFLLEALNNITELETALFEISLLPPLQYNDEQWQVLDALFTIMKLSAAELHVLFQKKGQIDFIENTQAALIALGSDEQPTDLALALDYQIKHILLDEFQDTSYTQFKLLEKLVLGWQPNDGRSLFIVGDPMQSIYLFREAEVSLFLNLYQHGLKHIKLTPISLRKNFRASQQLVTWCNQQFHTIFPAQHNIATGAVSYTASISGKDNAEGSNIIIHELINANDDIQADKIALLVKQLIAKNPEEKIAILVRARSHLQAIIPALNHYNLPYQAIDIDPLATKQYIQDIFALTTALLHPGDRVAWLSILRAPWAGLTLADLLIIAGTNAKTIIFTRLTDTSIQKQLSIDGQQRLARILPILTASINARFRQHLRYWIENTWRQLGGPACLKNKAQIDDVNSLFQLFDQLNIANEPFNLERLKTKMKSLFAQQLGKDNTLQLMTAHSAKGLEFDTVILPHLEKQPPNDQNQLLHWLEYPLQSQHPALILAPIHATADDKDPIYQFIVRQRKKRTESEINRLLYVAVTRAKKHLYLFYNNDGNVNSKNSFLSKFTPCFTQNPSLVTRIHIDENVIEQSQPKKHFLTRLSGSWQNPWSSSLATKASEKKRTGFKLRDHSRKYIGTVIHHLLQTIAETSIDVWQQKSLTEKNRQISYHLQQLNFPKENLNSAITTINQIITQTLNDPRGQWILQNHHKALCEFAISTPNADKIEKYIIDRTFIDETGTRWIIDYKTSTFDQEDLEQFLQTEENKYRDKMQQYAQAFHSLEAIPIKIGLYFPALPNWREWSYK